MKTLNLEQMEVVQGGRSTYFERFMCGAVTGGIGSVWGVCLAVAVGGPVGAVVGIAIGAGLGAAIC